MIKQPVVLLWYENACGDRMQALTCSCQFSEAQQEVSDLCKSQSLYLTLCNPVAVCLSFIVIYLLSLLFLFKVAAAGGDYCHPIDQLPNKIAQSKIKVAQVQKGKYLSFYVRV